MAKVDAGDFLRCRIFHQDPQKGSACNDRLAKMAKMDGVCGIKTQPPADQFEAVLPTLSGVAIGRGLIRIENHDKEGKLPKWRTRADIGGFLRSSQQSRSHERVAFL